MILRRQQFDDAAQLCAIAFVAAVLIAISVTKSTPRDAREMESETVSSSCSELLRCLSYYRVEPTPAANIFGGGKSGFGPCLTAQCRIRVVACAFASQVKLSRT